MREREKEGFDSPGYATHHNLVFDYIYLSIVQYFYFLYIWVGRDG